MSFTHCFYLDSPLEYSSFSSLANLTFNCSLLNFPFLRFKEEIHLLIMLAITSSSLSMISLHQLTQTVQPQSRQDHFNQLPIVHPILLFSQAFLPLQPNYSFFCLKALNSEALCQYLQALHTLHGEESNLKQLLEPHSWQKSSVSLLIAQMRTF